MIKILLLFLIFANISPSSVPVLDFGVETDFNKENREFNIDSSDSETMIIAYIDIEDKQLKLQYSSQVGDETPITKEVQIDSPGAGVMLRSLPNAVNTLNFTSLDDGEIKGGKIWIYPLDRAFNVDLSAKINKKYTIYYEPEASEEFTYKSFIYDIVNSAEAKTVLFTYERDFKDKSIEFKNLVNPFEMCWFEDFCDEMPEAYTFLTGDKMTLNVNFEKRTVGDKHYYVLPAHSFYTINPPKLKYDVETTFNKDNRIFQVDYSGELTGLITYISTENTILKTSFVSKNSHMEFDDGHDFKSPGGGHVFLVSQDCINILCIKSQNENEKGTIWVQPLSKSISIDLSKKVEQNFTIEYDDMLVPLNYTVSNLNEDKKVVLNYQKEFKDDNGETIKLSNPFMICKGEECKENIDSYTFAKGQDYTISIKFVNQTGRYFLPAYSFYYENEKPPQPNNNSKFLSLCLIYLGLLLIL